jgi:hypothetical protein
MSNIQGKVAGKLEPKSGKTMMKEPIDVDFEKGELGSIETEDLFAYDGYNPKHTMSLLRKIESDEDVLEKDIKTCCFFVVNRGSRIVKATSSMSVEGSNIMKELSKKYKMVDRTPKGKDEITVARIAGIMPKVCARLCSFETTRIIGIVPQGLPRFLCFPGGPAIIPVDDEALFQLWLQWALTFNQVITRGQDRERVENFGRIIQNSGYVPENAKHAIIRELSKK